MGRKRPGRDLREGALLLNPPDGILAKGRPRTRTSKVGGEELDQVSEGPDRKRCVCVWILAKLMSRKFLLRLD